MGGEVSMVERERSVIRPDINGQKVVPDGSKMLPIARKPITSSDHLTIFAQSKRSRKSSQQ